MYQNHFLMSGRKWVHLTTRNDELDTAKSQTTQELSVLLFTAVAPPIYHFSGPVARERPCSEAGLLAWGIDCIVRGAILLTVSDRRCSRHDSLLCFVKKRLGCLEPPHRPSTTVLTREAYIWCRTSYIPHPGRMSASTGPASWRGPAPSRDSRVRLRRYGT